MNKVSIELSKFEVAHLANMVSTQATLHSAELKPTIRFTGAKYASRELRAAIKDLVDFETSVQEEVKAFVKPFNDLAEELKGRLEKEGISEEENAEVNAALAANTKEREEKLNENFKEKNDKYSDLCKEKLVVSLYEDKFDALKHIFDLYATDKVPQGKDEAGEDQFMVYGEDLVMAWSDALTAAKKVE